MRVAAWRDTDQVMTFIARVAADIKGCIHDEHELRSFAARSFREGKPRLTMAELRPFELSRVCFEKQVGLESVQVGQLRGGLR